jgi:hypothetical protein
MNAVMNADDGVHLCPRSVSLEAWRLVMASNVERSDYETISISIGSKARAGHGEVQLDGVNSR